MALRHTRNRYTGFLIEIIVAILFFAVSAAAVLRIFAFSYQKSLYADTLSSATLMAQSLTEQIKNAPELDAQQIAGMERSDSSGTYTLYLDDKMVNPVPEEQAVFLVTASLSAIDEQPSGVLYALNVAVTSKAPYAGKPEDSLLFELSSAFYRKQS